MSFKNIYNKTVSSVKSFFVKDKPVKAVRGRLDTKDNKKPGGKHISKAKPKVVVTARIIRKDGTIEEI